MKINASTLNLALCMGRLTTSTITGFTGCAGERSNRSTGESIDDQSLNSHVREALNDNPEHRFSDVNVDTFRGKEQLSGFVDNRDQKSRATRIAKQVQGIKELVNNITVRKYQHPLDDDGTDLNAGFRKSSMNTPTVLMLVLIVLRPRCVAGIGPAAAVGVET